MERNLIGIYAGSDSSWAFIRTALAPYAAYGLQPKLVTLRDILEKDILNPTTTPLVGMFLMGGRNNKRFREDMGVRGLHMQRQFVWHGGHIVGICKGAALGGTLITHSSPDGVFNNRDNLNFIEATMYGQLPLGQDMVAADGWPTATVATLALPQHNNREASSIYWRGCGIRPHAGETITVLARFKALKEEDGSHTIAVARKNFGAGTFTASAVHIELTPDILRNHPNSHGYDRDDGTRRLDMADTLEQHTSGLQTLTSDIMEPVIAGRTYTPGVVWNIPKYA